MLLKVASPMNDQNRSIIKMTCGQMQQIIKILTNTLSWRSLSLKKKRQLR